MLKRFPEWNVDMENAELSCTSTVRGWETLPAYIGDKPLPVTAPKAVPAGAAQITPASVAGTWAMVVEGPTGPQPNTLEIRDDNGQLSGVQTGDGVATPVEEIKLANGEISWTNKISKPLKMTLTFSGTVEGDSMTGKVKAGFIGKFPFSGKKTQ
jgi:hypothetical protein